MKSHEGDDREGLLEQTQDVRSLMSQPIVEKPQIIAGIMGAGEFHILSRSAKTHKSNLALNIAFSIVHGREAFGMYEITSGIVLYVQAELTAQALRERLRLMMRGFGIVEDDSLNESFHVLSRRIHIDNASEMEGLADLVEHLRPDLVIVDPFYCFHGRDENCAHEITPVLNSLKSLAMNSQAALLLIHHQGKKAERSDRQTGHRARGSSALADVPDGSWSLERTAGGHLTLYFEMRNRPAPEALTLKVDEHLQIVGVGSGNPSSTWKKVVLQAVETVGEMPYQGVIATIRSARQVGDRQAIKDLRTLQEEGSLHAREEGKHTFYRTIATSVAEQPNSPKGVQLFSNGMEVVV